MSAYKDQGDRRPPAPSLVKVTHCGKDIYGSSVPQRCPICGEVTVCSWDLLQAPVSIPCPFSSAHNEECSFVLKPTKGCFIREYDGYADLHVGITTSKGTVYHYNEAGIHQDNTGWEQCVSVPLVPPDQYALIYQWDTYLEQFSSAEKWRAHRYDEHNHNCYTFALGFINSLLHLQGKNTFSKDEFTQKFVLPRSRRASRYITLCHQVSEKEYYITDQNRA
ncbi:MKRN2 opposite strand protein [Gastrophryne carolinensis]